MAVTPRELIETAQRQAEQRAETWQRSAISRAYYASYHRCKDWEQGLPELGYNVGPSGGRHQELINRLQHPARACSEGLKSRSVAAGALLASQRLRRVQADYDVHGDLPKDAVCEQLREGQQLLACCDLALSTDKRQRVVGRITGAGTPPPNPNPSGTPPSAPH